MARSLGASRLARVPHGDAAARDPGIANAFLLLFAASLADFATPLILPGTAFPCCPTQAYLQITGMFDLRGGAALSFALLVPRMIVLRLQRYWVSRRQYVDRHRQRARANAVRQHDAGSARGASRRVRGVTLIIVYFYALLLYASLVVALGANHSVHAGALPVRSSPTAPRRSRHADHRGVRDAARGLYGILGRLPRRAQDAFRAAARWSSCR
jgi:iron(III) transport system permease protein